MVCNLKAVTSEPCVTERNCRLCACAQIMIFISCVLTNEDAGDEKQRNLPRCFILATKFIDNNNSC